MRIEISLEKCTGCGACVEACPFGALALDGDRAVVDRALCTFCGACVEVCGPGAITLDRGEAAAAEAPDDSSGLWVLAEQRAGELARVTFELLGEGARLAKTLGQELAAVYIGADEGHLAELIRRGASRVYAVIDPALKDFRDDLYTAALEHLVRAHRPAILLAGATYIGRSYVPRVAARLRTGLTADCTALDIVVESGVLAQTRPTFGGNLMATILCEKRRPQMATVRPRTFAEAPTDDSRRGQVTRLPLEQIRVEEQVALEKVVPGTDEIDLTDAEIIISGGRGLNRPEGFALLEELAGAVGGVLGASRAAVDAGWIAYGHQVGQTGKTVRPKIYFACGISGAIQHLAGMGTSELIVAINKDPEAPIFRVANYGIVGDLYEVVPALLKELKAGRS